MALAGGELHVLVYSVTWALFFTSSIFLALRFYSRLRNRNVGLYSDDWILFAGWLFLLLASAHLTWLTVVLATPGSTLKLLLARIHHNLQSIALGLTKTSFGVTLLRLMPGGWESKVIWTLLITMNLQFAIHIITTWQAICGAPDDNVHIVGTSCWRLDQSVTFAVFSAVYSAACDFILALLPWKMIFNLQMQKSERIGIALALSMGVLAGIMGVMKAVQSAALSDVGSKDYASNQAVYWIWSMAEPNVTIISASVPVLRGFVRSVRNGGTNSTLGAGAYVKTNDSSSRYHGRSHADAARSKPKEQDGDSDLSISGRGHENNESGGIMWTTEVSVEYEARTAGTIRLSRDPTSIEAYEMGLIPDQNKATGIKIISQREKFR